MTPNVDLNSQPAIEERQLLGVSPQQQMASFQQTPQQVPQQVPQQAQQQAIQPKIPDNILLADIIYAESASEGDKVKAMVGSTVLNRLESGRGAEFGDSIAGVVYSQNSPYYSASKNSELWQQTMTGNFPDKASERAYKKSLQIAGGLMTGTIPRHPAMFFFTGSEVSGIKRSKKSSFNFKAVKETGRSGKYHTYSY